MGILKRLNRDGSRSIDFHKFSNRHYKQMHSEQHTNEKRTSWHRHV